MRVTNSLGEVPVLDRIHFGGAELTALYLRRNAELAKGKWPPGAESTGAGNAPQKNIASPASTQAVA